LVATLKAYTTDKCYLHLVYWSNSHRVFADKVADAFQAAGWEVNYTKTAQEHHNPHYVRDIEVSGIDAGLVKVGSSVVGDLGGWDVRTNIENPSIPKENPKWERLVRRLNIIVGYPQSIGSGTGKDDFPIHSLHLELENEGLEIYGVASPVPERGSHLGHYDFFETPQGFVRVDWKASPTDAMRNSARDAISRFWRRLESNTTDPTGEPFIFSNTFVVQSDTSQASCFYLRGVGLITCDHPFPELDGPDVTVIDVLRGETEYKARIHRRLKAYDICIVSDPGIPDGMGLPLRRTAIERGASVVLVGFPEWSPGATGTLVHAKVIGFRKRDEMDVAHIDARIIPGNSGGPVLAPIRCVTSRS
jgi:hypothetical protein